MTTDSIMTGTLGLSSNLDRNGPINILMISRSSFDKSVTGNNILQKRVFTMEEFDGTPMPRMEMSYFRGRKIQIVDTPGIMDGISPDHSKAAIIKFLKSWYEGFDAIVIVMRYPVNMTLKEMQTITIIKDIIGEDNLKNYGILLFTNGVHFKNYPEETFESYLERQVSDFKSKGFQNLPRESLGKLIVDLKRHCVLFDNENPDRIDIQTLMAKIDHMKYVNGHKRYTKIHWLAYKKSAVILLVVIILIGVIIVVAVNFA